MILFVIILLFKLSL